jgi:restriction system protein
MSEKVNKEISPSKAVASKTIYEAFKILKTAGGELPGKTVIDKVRQNLTFSDWETEVYEKTGYVRWVSIMHFYTVDCMKAGYLRKSKGIWYLTPEGEEAMKKGAIGLLESASSAYRKWSADKKKIKIKEPDNIDIEENTEQEQKANLGQLEDQAIDGIKQFIIQRNAYGFQDMVAALLRAMGYHTPFVSPKGKDGGIDIIAYQDPLGIQTPRIKVQVKHYPENPIAAESIRSLKGLINSGEEVGLFVTSGRFSNEAERFAREANVHIKLINGEDFISLWQEFYNKMPDEDKSLLPLQSIYFLGSSE